MTRISNVSFARLGASVGILLSLAACSGKSDKPADSGAAANLPPSVGAATAPSCATGATITSDGIGAVQLGRSLPDLRTACSARDTALRVDEGQTAFAVVVPVDRGIVIAFADSAGGPIVRIVTYDSVYKTAAGIGVGATVAKLRTAHPAFCAGVGATGVDAWTSSTPNVVFATSGRPRVSESGNTAAALPGDAVVTGVIVARNTLPACTG